MKLVTVGDLRDQIGKDGPRPLLYCQICGGEYSANSGDYFMAPKTHVFRCCGKPMRLVTKHTSYRETNP